MAQPAHHHTRRHQEGQALLIRLYSATEIRDLLNGVGLEVSGIYSNGDKEPLSADSRVMLVVASKAAR